MLNYFLIAFVIALIQKNFLLNLINFIGLGLIFFLFLFLNSVILIIISQIIQGIFFYKIPSHMLDYLSPFLYYIYYFKILPFCCYSIE